MVERDPRSRKTSFEIVRKLTTHFSNVNKGHGGNMTLQTKVDFDNYFYVPEAQRNRSGSPPIRMDPKYSVSSAFGVNEKTMSYKNAASNPLKTSNSKHQVPPLQLGAINNARIGKFNYKNRFFTHFYASIFFTKTL